MEPYYFWQDLFDTYQSLSDWMKFVWLVAPMAFCLGVLAMTLRYRVASMVLLTKMDGRYDRGELLFTIYRVGPDQLKIFKHGMATDLDSAVLPIDGGIFQSANTLESDAKI
ncbi:MAG: hypothetical protein GKR97_17085 [Rhizobiaceae bacterium]|nr:hypothetical protein [Rhizobiaceae bacterium]